MTNYLIIIAFTLIIVIFAILVYILVTLKNSQSSEKNGSELLENKLAKVSDDLNKIENDLSEFKQPMNEMTRFLVGDTKSGKLGEWNLESIVRDVLPANTDAILKDAKALSEKYILRNSTSNYVVLYIASEKIIDLVNQIDDLRQECLSNRNTLIVGPNALAGFLDTVRLGHYAIKMNENAKKVANTVRGLITEFKKFDKTTVDAVRNLNSAINKVEDVQTRINVLGRELKKADESFDKHEEEE